jgi:hypothetical protein
VSAVGSVPVLRARDGTGLAEFFSSGFTAPLSKHMVGPEALEGASLSWIMTLHLVSVDAGGPR